MIYYYDFVAILGTIFYNVFDRLGKEYLQLQMELMDPFLQMLCALRHIIK